MKLSLQLCKMQKCKIVFSSSLEEEIKTFLSVTVEILETPVCLDSNKLAF